MDTILKYPQHTVLTNLELVAILHNECFKFLTINNLSNTSKNNAYALLLLLQSFVAWISSITGPKTLFIIMSAIYMSKLPISYIDDDLADKCNETNIDRVVRYLTHEWSLYECRMRLKREYGQSSTAKTNTIDLDVTTQVKKNTDLDNDETKEDNTLVVAKFEMARLGVFYLHFGRIILKKFVQRIQNRFVASSQYCIEQNKKKFRAQQSFEKRTQQP